jgi:hypothetical protein
MMEDREIEALGGMPVSGIVWDRIAAKTKQLMADFQEEKDSKWVQLNMDTATKWEWWVREGKASDGVRSRLEEAMSPGSSLHAELQL